jgi:hypothetical protein
LLLQPANKKYREVEQEGAENILGPNFKRKVEIGSNDELTNERNKSTKAHVGSF